MWLASGGRTEFFFNYCRNLPKEMIDRLAKDQERNGAIDSVSDRQIDGGRAHSVPRSRIQAMLELADGACRRRRRSIAPKHDSPAKSKYSAAAPPSGTIIRNS